MDSPFRSFLSLLEQIQTALERLSDLALQKTRAVRSDNLTALDQVLHQEQAIALSFRSLEKKRSSLLAAMGLETVPLSNMANAFPPEMRLEARQVIDRVRTQYKVYLHSAEVARNTLECNLHEIEKVIATIGATPTGGPGYQSAEPELPHNMRTDFRA